MKKIFTYIACALLALGAVSCAKDGMKLPESEKDGLTLRFSLGNPTTKADRLSVGNEDRVNKIDYFFFEVVDGKLSEDTAPIIPMRTLTPDDKLLGEYDLTLTTEDLALIYANPDAEVGIYAIANFTGTYPETITLAELKKIEVRSTFAGTERWPHPLKTTDNNLSFVMTGELVLSLFAESNVVPMERLASKVTVEFNYYNVPDPHDSNITWVPQDKGKETRVYLSNAIATTTLGGPLSRRDYITDSGSTWQDGTRDIFEYSYDYMSDLKGAVPYYYTYPIKMEAGDANQPYIKLVLPWYAYENSSLDENGFVKEGAAPIKQKEVYYKIALPINDLKKGNRIYQYTADIRIVGADTEVEIDATYYVKNWLSGDPVSSNLATGRYLSLDIPKNTYDMYSSLVQILYVSSGDVELIINDIYQEDLSAATGVTVNHFMQYNEGTGKNEVTASSTLLSEKKITAKDIEGWVTTTKSEDGRPILQVSHVLDNSMTTSTGAKNTAFDMAPYVYDITLHLAEDTEHIYDKTITITQYPSMFVTSQKSNGYAFVNGHGYNERNTDDNGNSLGSLATRPGSLNGTGTNNNPYIYTISTSIAPDNTYKIGDPRKREVENLSNLGLTNYYPTDPEGTENMISPKFIVASSYGKTSYFNLATAEKRCASYQENGYPAGRWRVPTFAEIRFMVTLSRHQFIPSLYEFTANDDIGYWSANGKAIGNASGLPELDPDNTYNTAVRCVYDVWYWGDEPYQAGATSWLQFQDNK